MVEFNGSFDIRIRLNWVFRIYYTDLCLEYIVDTKCCNICSWEHDRHCCDHQEGHDDLHCILNECHNITNLHGSIVYCIRSTVDDQHRDTIHNEHHRRHHKSHTSVNKQVCLCKSLVCLFKTFFFVFFTAECADNRDTCQDLTCYQVQFVNQSLQYCKLRHCHLEQNNDHNKDQDYCKTKDPCHRRIRLQYTDHATDTKDRRI